ncbi:MAG: hypothetical protein JST73_09170 [Actinobacteria bacterium]|nr:hypothetical protein [Actinomycetota bacterium]
MPTEVPVALVTTDLAAVGETDHDLDRIIGALGDLGIAATAARWRDPTVTWDDFELVVIRSPWDYPEHLADFLAWMARIETATTVRNCPTMIRWNLDKTYLSVLQRAGIPIVPTEFCDDAAAVDAALDRVETPRVVVKPNISIGSRDSGLFDRGDPRARGLAADILTGGRRVLVQPAVERVAEVGEHDLVCFDGRFSHAFVKGPILRPGGGFLGGTYTEVIDPVTPTDAEIDLAERAGRAIADAVGHETCGCGDTTPLYARFDIVDASVGPLLLEAELFEPAFFLDSAPGAAERFAEAVRARLAPSDR